MEKFSPGKTMLGILKSKKLALVLISLLTTVVTLQVIWLAREWNPSTPQLGMKTSEIYSSLWFKTLTGLLLVNLLTCTATNLYQRLRSGTRNWALLGSTVFHAGLTIIIIGTLVTGSSRIFCTIKLILGEPKSIPYQALLTKANSGFDQNDRFSLTMRDQRTVVNVTGNEPQTQSLVELSGGTAKTVKTELTDSQQLRYRDIYMYPNKYGFAVRLTVTDNKGKTVSRQTVPLDTMDYGSGVKTYNRDYILLKPLADNFSFIFYPDLGQNQKPGDVAVNKSDQLTNPGLYISAPDKEGIVSRKTVLLGEGFQFKGYQIKFTEVRPWTEFMTCYDPGARVVFAGIMIALVGQAASVLLGKNHRQGVF